MASQERGEGREYLSASDRFHRAQRYEGELQRSVHEAGKKVDRTKEIPGWLVKAFVLTRLFQIETALASEMENEVIEGDIPFAEEVKSDVEMPQATRDALAYYAEHQTTFSITVQTREGEVITGYVQPDEFLGDHPRIIEGTVVDFTVLSRLSPEEFQQVRDALAETSAVVRQSSSKNDDCYFSYTDPGMFIGHTSIIPSQQGKNKDQFIRIDQLSDTGNMRWTNGTEPMAFGFSFDEIGGPHVPELFYHDPLQPQRDIQGFSVAWSGVERERGEKIFAEYLPDIERGMSTVQGQFGAVILENNLQNIVLTDHNEQNAYARWDGVYMEEDLVVGIEEGKLSKENLTEIVEHELYHMIDYRYAFSQELEPLFLSSDPSTLEEFNESAFSKRGFGGHAQENTHEFFASVMNSLDDPNWEESVQKLSPDARDVYCAALREIFNTVEANQAHFASGSLLRELPTRIAYLETIL